MKIVRALTFAFALLSGICAAQTYSVLYNFPSVADGLGPVGPLTQGPNGTWYGAARGGGANSDGLIYSLDSSNNETILYSFASQSQCHTPNGRLVVDSSGNIFGTCESGGAHSGGLVYELSLSGSTYTLTDLYDFTDGYADGANPQDGLVMDASGNLYGTTVEGPNVIGGAFFQLQPPVPPSSTWTFVTVTEFRNTLQYPGAQPMGVPTLAASGTFYGTTFYGGDGAKCASGTGDGCGLVYSAKPNRSGGWTTTILFNFAHAFANDAANPIGQPSVNSTETIMYGTSTCGGSVTDCGNGTIWTASLSGGIWSHSVLYDFTGGSDGTDPWGNVLITSNGLITTARFGGSTPFPFYCSSGCGTIVQLAHQSGGGWLETTLHQFAGPTADGSGPTSIQSRSGNYYGPGFGGSGSCNGGGCGIIWKFVP